MSADRDVTRIVRSWLHEDGYEDADRILNLVLDEIDTTPQRPASWLARRFPQLSTYARFGVIAAAVVLAAAIGIGIYANTVGGPGPVPTPSPTASPTPSLAPSSSSTPLPDPIVGTWVAGETTCEQQVAALEAAGFTTDQMAAGGVDPTCANGIVADGAEHFSLGSQFTLIFLANGSLTLFEDGVRGWSARYSLGEGSTFEASDVSLASICTTWRYMIDGDELTIEMADPGCAGSEPSPINDQLAQTVIFQTSPFTREP
jgi:hypothetical protein